MSKKLLQYYQSKMQTGGKVLPLYADGDPVPARYAPIPRASDLRGPMPVIAKTADEARVARAFNNGTIRPGQSQNRVAKALAVAANPATAASYVVKGQRIPDNFDRAETNRYEVATSVVNPFSYLKQVVDTQRDLREGNYGSAAINAMGILPTRLPNFGRITSANLDGFLGKQLNNVSREMEHLRGKNNEGVFMMRNRDDIVVKLEDANRTAHFTDTPEFAHTNMAEKMRDIPDNLPISKTLYQLDDVRLKNYQTPMRASFMKRVTGVPGGQLEPSQFVKIPDKSYQELYSNLKTLRNNDLAFDYFGNNYLYNPNTQQFGLFDIGLQPKKRGYWADDVYGASSKELFGIEASGKNIKDAIREKMSGDFRYTMEPEYDAFYDGASKLSLADLQAITAEGSRRVSQRIKDALANMNYYAEGGPVDPPVRDNTYYRVPVKQYVNRDRLRPVPTTADNMLRYVDIATDVMQAGNFIPHPIGQAIGKAGNVAGAWVDGIQAGRDVYRGDYGSAAVNAISLGIPAALTSKTFRRNSKYLTPGQPLYPLSPQAGRLPGGYSRTRYIEPFTKVRGMTDKSILANRALLGALGAESVYDTYEEGGEPAPYFKTEQDRQAYRDRLREESKKALQKVSDDSQYLIATPYHKIEDGNNCINGVCGLNIAAGLNYNNPVDKDRYISNVRFAKNVQKGKEDYYRANDNFEIGDHIQYVTKKGKPEHSKIIYDVLTDEQGNKRYAVIHNGGTSQFYDEVLTDQQMKDMIKEKRTHVYRPGYNLDKETLRKQRLAMTSPEARQALRDRKASVAFEQQNDPEFTYGIRKDSQYYNDQPEGMREFIKYANDRERINELIPKLDKLGMAARANKDSVHDSLLNVFGILGQENKWDDRVVGGSGGVENLVERMFKPKSWSIGPGQIKFNQINPEMRKEFGIERPRDLYNWNKLLPLMVAMDSSNRSWMERQGDKFSERIVGEKGLSSNQMEMSNARMSPYFWQGPGIPNLRKFLAEEYDDKYGSYRMNRRQKEQMRESYIQDNIRKMQKVFDQGSYGQNVFDNIDKNLERSSPTFGQERTLPEVVIVPRKKDGGQHGGLDRWFAEKWVDVKSGKPCGRQEGESRAYPACRPSRRVNSSTPKTSSEMSPAEKARFKREKTSSQRISYNHQRNK